MTNYPDCTCGQPVREKWQDLPDRKMREKKLDARLDRADALRERQVVALEEIAYQLQLLQARRG